MRRTLLIVLMAASAASASAQDLSRVGDWLPPGSDIGAALLQRPREVLRSELAGGGPTPLARLGALAFRSPETLGGDARRAGLSCEACHAGGGGNTRFSIPGLSPRPGTVDVTHRRWNPANDDGLGNALSIPTLHGISATAPYGFRGRSASLREFTREVIVIEFSGREPPPRLLDALVAYQSDLAPLPNPDLGPLGRLTAAAPEGARRGERIFIGACAGCHIPSAGFQDGRRHDVGTGGPVDTPSLLELRFTSPYFHDGSAAGLAEVVRHFDRLQGLGLAAAEAADLVAYLEAIGGGERPEQPVTAASDLARLQDGLQLLEWPLKDEDPELAELLVRMLRGELGRMHQRFPREEHAPARDSLAAAARALSRIGGMAEAQAFPEAVAALARLQAEIAAAASRLMQAAAGSLYDPAAGARGP